MGLAKQKNESAAKGLGLANEKTKAQRKAWVWQMKKRKRSGKKPIFQISLLNASDTRTHFELPSSCEHHLC
jgi:hypothetical protein